MIGQVLQGRYQTLNLLGQGGMGAVYLAEDSRLGRRCAIKENVPDPSANPQALAAMRQQFQVEARTLANLDHPNLPKVYDFFSHAGNEYIVMEYVEGEDLGGLLQRHGGALPEKPVLIWIGQVLDALAYLHGQRPHAIIHRDIKPANIILTAQGKVKLVDFGLVKLLDLNDPRTATSMKGMGTPEYAPLEQYAGGQGHTDARSDVYSLGGTLYHLLTGVAPADIHQRILDPNRLAPPRRLNPALSPHVEAAILKAMEVHPDQRFQTAQAMRQALAGSSQPATVAPPRPGAAARRWPRWLWGLAAAGLVLIAFLVVRALVGELGPAPTPTPAPVVQASPGAVEPGATPTSLPFTPTSRLPAPTQALPAATAGPAGEATAVPTAVPSPGLTETAVFQTAQAILTAPTRTPTPTPTITPTPNATATAAMAIVWAVETAEALGRDPQDVFLNSQDGAIYLYVPAGDFLMGSTEDDPDANDDEKPQHRVWLEGYWIAQTEVSVAMYRKCVEAGACTEPGTGDWCTYGDASKADHPVNCVDWEDAAAYCAWAGGRLPTEAEWEKGARGGDGRIWPWGNDPPAGHLLNFADASTNFDWSDKTIDDGYEFTAPVGSYPAGASPYGLLDMAGNVWEWTADRYDEDYYSQSPAQNPAGPGSGSRRVLRGGSWSDEAWGVRAAFRLRYSPSNRSDDVGFRCARS